MIQMIETITVRTAPASPGAGMRCESAGGGLERGEVRGAATAHETGGNGAPRNRR